MTKRIIVWPQGQWIEDTEYHPTEHSYLGTKYLTAVIDSNMTDTQISMFVNEYLADFFWED